MASIKRRPLVERFQEKVEISKDNEWNGTPCWDWTGAREPKGYGKIRSGGRKGKLLTAHRVSWELYRGEIPEGEGYHGTCVLHRCDRPCCVNPDHLFLGTVEDNNADMKAKRRGKGKFHKGSRNGSAVLTESADRLVKQFLRRHNRNACEFLGRWLGVSRKTISNIKTGRRWSHIE